jgi:hypothetical protein
MGLGKQAKTLSKGQVDAVLGYLAKTRWPTRNSCQALKWLATTGKGWLQKRQAIGEPPFRYFDMVSIAASFMRNNRS